MKNYLKLGTKFLLTMSLSFLFLAVEAQERNLSGKVLDENDEGLPGVSIVIKDTNIGTITNYNGDFDLNIPEIGSTLIFSAVGYTTQEVVVGSKSIIDVMMDVDIAELNAIKSVFGADAPIISSTKSMTGHLLGAAGAVETISSILSIKYGIVPPTINHFTDDEGIDKKLNFTFNKAQKRDVKVLMSNTFGFGGHNACVLVKKFEI